MFCIQKNKTEIKYERIILNKKWKSSRKFTDPCPRHTEFYKLQVPQFEIEWESFRNALSSELPVTLRINSSRFPFFSHILSRRLHHEKKKLSEYSKEYKLEADILPIAWCTDTWQINVEKSTLTSHSLLTPLRNLLSTHTTLGHINKQELVSMIPALFLDIHSHHHILDMCASPGSKTSQLLDLLHCHNNNNQITVPTGKHRIHIIISNNEITS